MLTQWAKNNKAILLQAREAAPDVPIEMDIIVDMFPLGKMKFNELRKIAKAKGITVPFGTNKPALIKLLKGE